MAKKKPAKKPTRGAGVSVTMPTEPLAGDAKTTPIMAVMVQDEGASILGIRNQGRAEHSSSASAAPSRRSWSVLAMHRTGICSWTLTAETWNLSWLEYEHALSGPQRGGVAAWTEVDHQPGGFPALDNDRAELGVENER